jgi:hypothetical protein
MSPEITRVFRPLLVGLAGFAILAGASAAPTPPPEATTGAGWRALADARHREALTAFREAGPSREARVGEALALLNVQPVTAANRAAARALAEAIADGPLEDPWTAQARYLLGRIAQIHTVPADFAVARAHYQWLIERQPGSETGQAALVKFAIVQLTEVVPAGERRRRYDGLVAMEPLAIDVATRRDFHLTLAEACLDYDLGLERALHHSLAADAAGVRQPLRVATLLVRIAELARTLGQKEVARRYYQRFLAEVGTSDLREKLVREHLAALGPEAGL